MSHQVGSPRRRPTIWQNRRPNDYFADEQETHPTVDRWEPRYRRAVIASDVLSTLFAVIVVGGLVGSRTGMAGDKIAGLGAITTIVVLFSLGLCRVWNVQVLGQGAEEYGRLGRGLFTADVVLGLAGLAFSVVTMRPWVFLVVPTIALLAYPMRYGLRKLLHRARSDGRCLLPVLAAGSPNTLRDLIERTRINSHIGWRGYAAFTPSRASNASGEMDGIPDVRDLEVLADHVRPGR